VWFCFGCRPSRGCAVLSPPLSPSPPPLSHSPSPPSLPPPPSAPRRWVFALLCFLIFYNNPFFVLDVVLDVCARAYEKLRRADVAPVLVLRASSTAAHGIDI